MELVAKHDWSNLAGPVSLSMHGNCEYIAVKITETCFTWHSCHTMLFFFCHACLLEIHLLLLSSIQPLPWLKNVLYYTWFTIFCGFPRIPSIQLVVHELDKPYKNSKGEHPVDTCGTSQYVKKWKENSMATVHPGSSLSLSMYFTISTIDYKIWLKHLTHPLI